MAIEKLFVLSYGEIDYLTGMLNPNGRHQSESGGRRLISKTMGRHVTVISPTDWGPESETADIIHAEIYDRARYTTRKYVHPINGTKITNVFRTILDVVYDCRENHQDDVVILVVNTAKINRLTKYFCKDNDITFSMEKYLGSCCGYEINCISKECRPSYWAF